MSKLMALFLAGLLLTLQQVQANPIRYDFSQGGYAGGAQLNGFFVGDDLDSNGQLSSFASEILDFHLEFTGTAHVSAFSLDFSDLFGLVYDLDGGVLGDGISGDREGLLAFDWQSLVAVGPGPLWRICDGSSACSLAIHQFGVLFSAAPVFVTTTVPEPAAGFLLLIGVLGLILARRHNRNSVPQ